MNERVKRLTEEASRLSPDERAEIVEGIMQSLDPVDPSIDAAWTTEARDRLEAYRRGEIQAVDLDDFLAKRMKT
jgi:putative addiction module component (TIGR02574 family)